MRLESVNAFTRSTTSSAGRSPKPMVRPKPRSLKNSASLLPLVMAFPSPRFILGQKMACSKGAALTRHGLAANRICMASEKEKVALGSILASGALTAAKAVVGLASGSLAILSEAAHSFIDLAATLMTYFAVRVSDKPADEEHHYGHGKIESVAALGETALLFVLSLVVFWEAGHRLLGGQGHAVDASIAAFAVVIGSIVIDFFRAR